MGYTLSIHGRETSETVGRQKHEDAWHVRCKQSLCTSLDLIGIKLPDCVSTKRSFLFRTFVWIHKNIKSSAVSLFLFACPLSIHSFFQRRKGSTDEMRTCILNQIGYIVSKYKSIACGMREGGRFHLPHPYWVVSDIETVAVPKRSLSKQFQRRIGFSSAYVSVFFFSNKSTAMY